MCLHEALRSLRDFSSSIGIYNSLRIVIYQNTIHCYIPNYSLPLYKNGFVRECYVVWHFESPPHYAIFLYDKLEKKTFIKSSPIPINIPPKYLHNFTPSI